MSGTSSPGGAGVPPQLDTSEAHSARVWNYLLGGKDNFAADREAADRQARAIPQLPGLARQNRVRLESEIVRDVALASSGLLNRTIGGPSVRPPQPPGISELTYAGSAKWIESQGPDRYRRGLYIHFQRTSPYPQLVNFDAPDSRLSCTRRRRSNTPLQALNLLNDPVFFETAQGLAVRTLREAHGDFPDKLGYAFQLALCRRPSTREVEDLTKYYEEQKELFEKDDKSLAIVAPFTPEGVSRADMAAWTGVSRVLINLDEFITRE